MRRFAAFGVGAVFGLVLSWSGMTNPDVLRDGLLFRDPYLILFFASALATTFVGMRVLKARRARALLTGAPLTWSTVRPERRHVAGSVLFGTGWAVADVCPGPIAAQLGQGVPWALATTIGLVIGVLAYVRRSAVAPERGPRALRQRPEGAAVAAEG
ncbi:MAG TPA: DUF6691 family protein [Solirubrobacter sp.]|nr:DUF6691 family protein [Solirubrobacter sp.]